MSEKLEAKEHKMEFGPIIDIAPLPAEVIEAVMPIFDTDLDGEISKQEAKTNDAHESLFQTLTNLGVSAEDLALALGVEPKAVREKRQAEQREENERNRKEFERVREEARLERERQRKEFEETRAADIAERDRLRKEWEAGQQFDAEERAKIKPAVVVGPGASDAIGLIAKVSWIETPPKSVMRGVFAPKAIKTQYTNNTAKFATFIVRVGTNDRPDRVVAPGKTVTSSYTTTIKTGFTGQKLVVTHKESGVVVLEQTL
jgi:hypothetical protein